MSGTARAGLALTAREERVYALLLSGAGIKDVARTLRLPPLRVHGTIRRIYAKRDVHSQAQLIAQDGRRAAPAEHAEAGGDRDLPLAGLSPRVAQAAALTATGRTRAQVAREMGTSPDTVKKQLTTAYATLDIGRRAELAALCAGRTPFRWGHLRPRVEAGWQG